MQEARLYRMRRGTFWFIAVMLAGWPGVGLAGPYSDGISDGVAHDDAGILGWATGCTGWRPSYVDFGKWSDTVGPAPAVTNDVVSFGDGGYAVATFDLLIADGPGADFGVFENSLKVGSNIFAELGFVEVSSDGQNYVRFPSHYITADESEPEVGAFEPMDVTNMHNLAGKHVNNETMWLGTPFDLADLLDDPAVQSGVVDLGGISRVKIIDVVGDGSTFDSQGNPIYDPYPTGFGSGGFDLDAVAILNAAEPGETAGDVTGDGFVGADDLTRVLIFWGQPGRIREEGDLTGEGFVGADDYIEVLTYWGNVSEPRPAGVPEPGTLVVLMTGGILFGAVGVRERSRG